MGSLWSHLLFRAGRCQLLTRLLCTGVHQDYTEWLLPLLPLSSRNVLSALSQILEIKKGKCISLHNESPSDQTPRYPGEDLGEVSHHVVWLGCFSSFIDPLCAFGKSCHAVHSSASGWPLPNLAALHRVGPDPPKRFLLCILVRLSTVTLCPLLVTVATFGLFLKASFCLKGIQKIWLLLCSHELSAQYSVGCLAWKKYVSGPT